ncbi:galactose-1-phosphate uridylyltransferase [Alicyclobacillus fastidiosus]|uniref:Galactose-1-phosphate uridylyltransferase n=1 Tax=Alicyclobacillus fastidiosus TaxID=392011 RepID=A0ABY6ZFQ1_9BACL|nr:galactose-1-phosphate uridylyltransferase [Alicyclobacillus fastidiosus]WAH40949.1 galactose-1-phosphate uridylyltransferase [Alicyclobacillus fastidiosus]GMA62458.1 galactose-1-phosphate uridylyltransferase [Alicyclobacillus fastidiosus]
MAELRFNPLLRDWTMVASNRQNRPNMPKGNCPFCPGSGRVPDHYDVLKYDNDFPALSPTPPEPDDVATELYSVAPARGKCEVILYSPEHNTTLPQLSVGHIRKLVDLWTERFVALSADEQNKYVFIFENRGPEVGVTMPHPHGQIYAYPYVPQKIRVELDSCKAHHEETGHCLICDINAEEARVGQRMLYETEHFVSYLPFFTDYPYGAFISSKGHRTSIAEFSEREKDDLALILKRVTAGMDHLFSRPFPYMMCIHQSPVGGEDTSPYYHFHIEFYPPLRARDQLKYLASSESGAWAPCNPLAVEETAVALRQAILDAEREMREDA